MAKEKKTKRKSARQEGFIVYEGLQGIRVNPTMYLGSLGADMAYRCVKEPVDNAYDEAIAGRNKVIEVFIDYDSDVYTIADQAGGIPTDFKQLENGKKISIMTAAVTMVHAGGKFNDKAYKTSSGTHGVGVAAVNAVSEEMRIWSSYNDDLVKQTFSQGKITSKGENPIRVKKIDDDVAAILQSKPSHYGTIVAIKLDQTIVSEDARRGKSLPKNFTKAEPNTKQVGEWLKNMAYLNPGLELRFGYKKKGKVKNYVFKNKHDLAWVPKQMCEKRELQPMGKALTFKNDNISCAVVWADHPDTDNFLTFVNTSPTIDGGWHVTGFMMALGAAIKEHLPKTKGKKKDNGFTNSDLLIGLTGVFDWRMHGAQYTSQVKDKLASKVDREVYEVMLPVFTDYFNKNSKVAKNIIKRAQTMNKGREELASVVKSLAEVKKTAKGSSLPPELSAAPKASNKEREIFLVEGDSAGGCFVGSTKIKANGQVYTYTDLEERTRKGEKFIGTSFNIQAQGFEQHEFDEPRLTKFVHETVHVQYSVGPDTFTDECTLDHPWLVWDKGEYKYVAANELQIGANLVADQKAKVLAVVKETYAEPIAVYDATMPAHHNYCLASGVVVHNTAKDARDASYQEVLKAGGKPLNGLKAPLAKVIANAELQNLFISLGVNFKSLDPKAESPTFSTDNLRAAHLIILVDPDPDGYHIAVLFLAALYRLMPDLMAEGRVWCVRAPLFAALHNGVVYGGDTFEECRASAPASVKDKDITRIKGWGEVGAEWLEPIAFNPKTRKLIRINPFDDAEQARFFRGVVAEDASFRRLLLGLKE